MPAAKQRRNNGPRPRYLPSPEQIAVACERIQAGWTKQIRQLRKFGINGLNVDDVNELVEQRAWTAPTISTRGLSSREVDRFVGA